MQDLTSMLSSVRRPRLLMRAARIGAESYRRDIHLPRILGRDNHSAQGSVLWKIMELEAELNALRLAGDSSYSLTRHVDVMIALVGEARMSRTPPQDVSIP